MQQLKKRYLFSIMILTVSLNLIAITVLAGNSWVVSEVEPSSWVFRRPAIYRDRVAWVEFELDSSPAWKKEVSTAISIFWPTPKNAPSLLLDIWSTKSESSPGFPYKAMVYDVVTGQLWDLKDELPPCTFQLIDIYGDWVITEMVCAPESSETIHGFNLLTNEYIKITPYEFGTANQRPSIDENYVLWTAIDCCSSDILMYDLDAQTTISVTNDGGSKHFPDKSGDWIVWSGGSSNDIYALNLATTEQITITNDPALQWYPRIDGDIIVWTDLRNDDGDVYSYDLSTRQEFPVATGEGTQNNQAIDGGLVTWTEYRDGIFYIRSLDLATGAYSDVHEHPPDTTILEPSMVSGDRVVWRYELALETYLYTAQRLQYQSYLPWLMFSTSDLI